MALVEYERTGPVGVVRLNRPERMNALGAAMLDELRAAFTEIDSDDAVRVGVITGSGRALCAGRDIKEANTADTSLSEQATTKNLDLFMENNHAKPMVSAVNGYAGGGGFYLATYSVDLVVAAESASFHIAEVGLGILHGWQTGFWFNLSKAVSTELAYGFRVGGRRAYDGGLANRVTTDGELMDTAMGMAQHVAAMPLPIIEANRALRSRLDNRIPEDVDAEGGRRYREIMDSGLAGEGDKAFLASRSS